ALADRLLAGRRIECQQTRLQEAPLPPGVQASAVLIGSSIGNVFSHWEIQLIPISVWLVGLHARPAKVIDQKPADFQSIVAHEFSIEPEARLVREQAVVRILFLGQFAW